MFKLEAQIYSLFTTPLKHSTLKTQAVDRAKL